MMRQRPDISAVHKNDSNKKVTNDGKFPYGRGPPWAADQQRQPPDTYSAPKAPSRARPGEGATGEGLPRDLGGHRGDHSPGGRYSAVPGAARRGGDGGGTPP